MRNSPGPSSNSVPSSSEKEFGSYYDERYKSGYMDSWGEWTELKIRAFFDRINVGAGGRWLDFGCGQGALTHLLVLLGQNANVSGYDVSAVAIEKARQRVKNAEFGVWAARNTSSKFDVIFSHHVLEHVQDIDETLDELDAITNAKGLHCHILPCGNDKSLEWKVANETKNGFEHNGRFFFEEDGHLRRLTSDQLIKSYQERGYKVRERGFANQHYGAYNWIISLGPEFIRDFANPANAISFRGRCWLHVLKAKLMILWRADCLTYASPSSPLKIAVFSVVLPIAKQIVSRFQRRLRKEITNEFRNSSGSEMLICFEKQDVS